MPATLTTEQLRQYRNAINANGVEGLKAVYQSLYAQGYNYAGWAYGVVSGNTIAGKFLY